MGLGDAIRIWPISANQKHRLKHNHSDFQLHWWWLKHRGRTLASWSGDWGFESRQALGFFFSYSFEISVITEFPLSGPSKRGVSPWKMMLKVKKYPAGLPLPKQAQIGLQKKKGKLYWVPNKIKLFIQGITIPTVLCKITLMCIFDGTQITLILFVRRTINKKE